MVKKLLLVVVWLSGCVAGNDAATSALVGAKEQLTPPSLAATNADTTSITLTVCGTGTNGAPAGFSVQWVTAAELEAAGGAWPEGGCAASYSGNANQSPYALGAGDCVAVVIDGQPFSDGHGGSSECAVPLVCGTEYAFRAFAHGGRDFFASDKSEPIIASTAACESDGCVLTQGYWKNHEDAWPVDELSLGGVTYSQSQLLAILKTPVRGNGLVSLAHQLIAASLNTAAGASGAEDLIDEANQLIDGLVIPPLGAGWLAPSVTGALTSALDDFNNGLTGPPHCSE